MHKSVLCAGYFFLISNLISKDYFVGQNGKDSSSGLSPESPYRSIGRAIKASSPGDIVHLLPGVYFESVEIRGKGGAKAPLRIIAETRDLGDVVISGAQPELRGGLEKWEREGSDIYSCFLLNGPPSRVLADGLDVFPYASPKDLMGFKTSNGQGPDQGYCYDGNSKKLYVRLNSRRGDTNPAGRLMCVAPPTGVGFDGMQVGKASDYNIGIIGTDNPPIIIEGLTFETPGIAGVYTESSNVTVRGCWFRGCRTAVAGNASAPRKGSHDVTIEYCDFSQEPAFQDAMDASAVEGGRILWRRKAKAQGLPDDKFKYEIGIVSNAGDSWVIRRNRIHDAFEGLATRAVSWSTNMKVEENAFDRLCDNGVETEDHSDGMQIRGNLFIDNFEAISYQPLDGQPWPGSVVAEGNVVTERVHTAEILKKIAGDRGAFKIGISLKNWKKGTKVQDIPPGEFRVPGNGLQIRNNAVFLKGGSVFKIIGIPSIPVEGVSIESNVLSAVQLSHGPELAEGHFQFRKNLCVTSSPFRSDWKVAAANGGEVVVTKTQPNGKFALTEKERAVLKESGADPAGVEDTINLISHVGPEALPEVTEPFTRK